MFVLAHLSDLHLASRPRPAELIGKRGLGFINWQRKRKYIHRPEIADLIVRDVKGLAPDHIAMTGDLVNLSLEDEYRRARAWLEGLGSPHDVTVVPGNHDVYVRAVAPSPAAYWGDYMRGDDGRLTLPFVRRRGNVALVALSTAVPTGPFMATGRLGERQLAGLADALDETRGLFRIVLIHHPPLSPAKRLHAAADRRGGAARRTRRAWRGASRPWPRPPAGAGLARWAGRFKNSCSRCAIGFGTRAAWR